MASGLAETTHPPTTGNPPLPDEPLPTDPSGTDDFPVDQPINSLGEDDEDAEDGQSTAGSRPDVAADDNDEESSPSSSSKGKGKGKVEDDPKGSNDASGEATPGDAAQPWQAVWSAERNAWYFWNTITSEVTWTNPLEPPSTSAPTSSTPFQPPLPKELPPPKPEDAPRPSYSSIPDIDPDLAYLLPPDQRGIGGSADAALQTAFFNARSGKFATGDNAKFDALDEYNRQKRFNDHYFDVDAWNKQKDEEHAKRKRDEAMGVESDSKITKKDMDRYRKKKAEQKWRKQAWLRD